MTKQKLYIIASILLFLISTTGFAQGGNPPPPMPPPPPGLPIDNSILILFFVAMAYGIFKRIQMAKGH